MFVGGWDISTRALDLVLVDIDGNRPPWWHRFELHGPKAWERTRTIGRTVPGPTSHVWDECVAFGVEEPRGKNAGVIYRAQGALIASLPAKALVYPLVPSEWRKAVGLPGNASKELVAEWSRGKLWPDAPLMGGYVAWPQDAHDAHCIALATATLINQEKAA